jgi:hypothetical protein
LDALGSSGIDSSTSSHAADGILCDLVAVRSFVVASTGAVHINAAVAAVHTAITTLLGEVIALALADLCNASGDDCLSASAKTLINSFHIATLYSLVLCHQTFSSVVRATIGAIGLAAIPLPSLLHSKGSLGLTIKRGDV